MGQIITSEHAAKFKELFRCYEEAVARAGTMLRAYGMDSRQFIDADEAATLLWVQLQKMQAIRGSRKWFAK